MQKSHKFRQLMYVLLVILAAWSISQTLAGGGDREAAKQAWPMIKNGALLVDVRSQEEFEAGHIEGAVNIEWDNTDALVAAIGMKRDRPVVFYCRSGNRAGKSIDKLAEEVVGD